MAKIFVTRSIPGDHIEDLKKAGFEVSVSEKDQPLTNEELIKNIKGVDAILSLLNDKIDGEVMDAAGPTLKIISNYAVGFDNININEATKRGIIVTNTPSDEVNEAVAEHTWALITALARRVVESDEFVRKEGYFAYKGGYKGWEPGIFLGMNLVGKTLGIIGLGRIGTMVARRAQGFGMNVIYNKHTRDTECESKLGVKYCELNELLTKSDVVTLHVPLTEETRHLIGKENLAKMKEKSYLVNTARGAVVDEKALILSLKEGHLAGAGLDVFDNEPNVSSELISMPNVILTPHIASATWEARNKMGEQAVTSIIDTLGGNKPQNIVDEKVWEIRRK